MIRYVGKRLLLIVPTLFGIITINFFIVQLAPGGPVDQMLAQMSGEAMGATVRIAGAAAAPGAADTMTTQFPGAEGVDPELIAALEKQFGFDRPLHERYLGLLLDYLRFDLGESYYQNRPVVSLVLERFPVSISLGLWSMLLTYLIAIPLGVAKAVRDGSRFDV